MTRYRIRVVGLNYCVQVKFCFFWCYVCGKKESFTYVPYILIDTDYGDNRIKFKSYQEAMDFIEFELKPIREVEERKEQEKNVQDELDRIEFKRNMPEGGGFRKIWEIK